MNKDLSFLPKLPSISMKGNIEPTEPNKILLTKIGGIPYIPRNTKYPTSKNGIQMICIAQLNYDQIFELLSSKEISEEFVKYFSCLPKKGILQIYLDYSEKLFDTSATLHYIKEYSLETHDLEKEKSLLKHYEQYYDKHGSLAPSFDEVIYMSNMKYEYNELNSTNQSHPRYEEFFGSDDEDIEEDEPSDEDIEEYIEEEPSDKDIEEYIEDKPSDEDIEEYVEDKPSDEDIEEPIEYCAQIGGYPYHLQDDMEFDDETEIILFSFVNDCLGLNISANQKQIKKLNFKKCGFDLSY